MKHLLLLMLLFVLFASPVYPQTQLQTALKALSKVSAATEVGVNKLKYSELIIDAKVEVNAALAEVPEGELKTALSQSMDDFVFAGDVWEATITEDRNNLGIFMKRRGRERSALFTVVKKLGDRLVKDYNAVPIYTGKSFYEFTRSSMLSSIWAKANKHLDNARELAK